jgi:hypothetical protein
MRQDIAQGKGMALLDPHGDLAEKIHCGWVQGACLEGNTAIFDVAVPSIGKPRYLVEPTTNTGLTKGGEQVWELTTGGTTHATTDNEPTWPASPTPGVTTQCDGTCVWTYLGTTPSIDVETRHAKLALPTRLAAVTTTTATASQVIVSGAVVEGVDVVLPEVSITTVTDRIKVKKSGTANDGTITIESDWVRNGTGPPSQIGASIITYNLTGTTLDGSTVAHVANGNRIELQASPESADSLKWRLFRTQAEGID